MSAARVKGRIQGRQSVDYTLQARAGEASWQPKLDRVAEF
jgi:hypothetical protein